MSGYYLGIDIGTTNIKGVAVDTEGNIVSSASGQYLTITKHDGKVEQEATEFYEKTCTVIKQLTKKLDKKKVRAISFSTQGGTIIPVDKHGNPSRKAILWMDNRADEESELLNHRFGEDYWYFNFGKRVQSISVLPKLLWLKRNEKKTFDKTYKFLQVPDYLNYKFTGNYIIDVSNASYCCFFDIRKRNWDSDILEKLGLDKERFSKVEESGKNIGKISNTIANQLGLPTSTEIITGAHDQTCVHLGTGIKTEEEILLSTGTAWVLYSQLNKIEFSTKKIFTLYCYALPKKWCFFLAMNGGIVLDWFMKNINLDINKIKINDKKLNDIIFLPHLYTALSPHYCAYSRGAFWGFRLENTIEDMILAIMESLAFETNWNLEELYKEGLNYKEITMLGGATKSKFWPQIISNVVNLPVKVIRSENIAALGAAILACKITDDTIECKIRKKQLKSDFVLPNKNLIDAYRKKFVIYKECFERLKNLSLKF